MAGLCSKHFGEEPVKDCIACHSTIKDLVPDYEERLARAEAAGIHKCKCSMEYYKTSDSCPRCEAPRPVISWQDWHFYVAKRNNQDRIILYQVQGPDTEFYFSPEEGFCNWVNTKKDKLPRNIVSIMLRCVVEFYHPNPNILFGG